MRVSYLKYRKLGLIIFAYYLLIFFLDYEMVVVRSLKCQKMLKQKHVGQCFQKPKKMSSDDSKGFVPSITKKDLGSKRSKETRKHCLLKS